MKNPIALWLSSVLLLVMTSYGATESLASPDQPDIHGMLVFGEEEVYLSHLPMFHPPHNYQIILAADLGKDAKSVYLKNRKEYPAEKIYTLAPLPFVLSEIVEASKPFTAALYRGHFERGGVPIVSDITVKIKKTIFFKKLPAGVTKPRHLNYILFGNNKEWYLAHQIVTMPDFDQIVGIVRQPKILEKRLKKKGQLLLTITDSQNTQPLKEGDKRPAFILGTPPVRISLRDVKSYYLEFDDLATK